MKITGGSLKGRRISGKFINQGIKTGELRPTSEKVREAVFNILAPVIMESVFIDLFSGTGAIGMEAMSRGAKAVYFIESDPKRARDIEALLDGCGCRPKAVILNRSASVFLGNAGGVKADIIFMDPPYGTGDLDEALGILADDGILNKGGLVMAEHKTKKGLPDSIGKLRKKKDYKYGDTTLSLYETGEG